MFGNYSLRITTMCRTSLIQNNYDWFGIINSELLWMLGFISCLSIVYWNITMDFILIIYCLKQWNYQNLVARFNVNFNTERKQHREPKSVTRLLIGALNGIIKLLSGWKIKFFTNRTTDKHEIKRKFVYFGEWSKVISLVNTRHYISSGVHSWNNFSIFHWNKQISST